MLNTFSYIIFMILVFWTDDCAWILVGTALMRAVEGQA